MSRGGMTKELEPVAGRDFGRILLEDELIPRYNAAVKELEELRHEYSLYRARRPNLWPGDLYKEDFLSHPRVNICFFWLGTPYIPKETQRKLVEELRQGHDVGPVPRQVGYEPPPPPPPPAESESEPPAELPRGKPMTDRRGGIKKKKLEQKESS